MCGKLEKGVPRQLPPLQVSRTESVLFLVTMAAVAARGHAIRKKNVAFVGECTDSSQPTVHNLAGSFSVGVPIKTVNACLACGMVGRQQAPFGWRFPRVIKL
jgi:hypothetical protein